MQRFSLYGVHKRDYQESVTTGQTDARTHRQTPDKVIRFAGDTKFWVIDWQYVIDVSVCEVEFVIKSFWYLSLQVWL